MHLMMQMWNGCTVLRLIEKDFCFWMLKILWQNMVLLLGKLRMTRQNATLAAYLVGAFGIAGSKEADDFCIKQLLPNKLKDQYCFKTTAALDCLHFVESEKIWLKK